MSEIALSSGIRSSLASLKGTSTLLETTTARLSSGKKVNSAVDNPTNYFAAENYNNRASALDGRLDTMSEAVQQINAADNGVTSIKSFLSQMKGLINNALSNTEGSERQALGEQFNELIVQIRDISKDSSYGGINLLYNNASTTVQFGESIGDSTLELQGFNVSAANGALENGEVNGAAAYANAAGVASSADQVSAYAASLGDTAAADTGGTDVGDAAWLAATAFYVAADANSDGAIGVDETGNLSDLASNAAGYTSAEAFAAASAAAFTGSGLGSYITTAYTEAAYDYAVENEYANYTAYALSIDLNGGDTVGIKSAGQDGGDWEIDWGSTNYQDDLSGLISSIETLESTLQTQSSKLANNLAVITERQDYTQNSIDILEKGADNLTLANMDEEGANLLSLQTSSALATQALSIASSQAQNVLKILG
jgi:flagellin-like hook-associated protein FlgL